MDLLHCVFCAFVRRFAPDIRSGQVRKSFFCSFKLVSIFFFVCVSQLQPFCGPVFLWLDQLVDEARRVHHERGRARRVDRDGLPLDNGQHILIGAYSATLDLMRSVGADPAHLLLRQPLALVDPAGQGLRLPSGPPLPAFVRAVLAAL